MAHLLDQADRRDLVARILRDRPGVSASAIAAELGVSLRSVFRDLSRLRDRGYPIDASRGRGGGLRLDPRWGLGRVLLSAEEALCTLLSLAISERLGMPMFAPEVVRARRKIVEAFPPAERRRLGPLRERIFIGPNASAVVRASYQEPRTAALQPLQVAFVEERAVQVVYHKPGGEPFGRYLEPHALVINWPAWYLLAFDRARADMRTFRFDRFVSVRALPQRFRPRPRDAARDLLDDARIPMATV